MFLELPKIWLDPKCFLDTRFFSDQKFFGPNILFLIQNLTQPLVQFVLNCHWDNQCTDKCHNARDASQNSPSTQHFLVSKVNFSHQHHNFWCPSSNFSSAPNTSTGAEIVGVLENKKLF